MISGGTPATAQDTTRAIGLPWPRDFEVERTSAAAPSTMPLAFPAVTMPSLPKAGRRPARVSIVVSARMWSSSLMETTPLPFFTSTGTISSSNTPRALAAAAVCCERSENSSMALRSTPYLIASFSAVWAMYRPQCESRRATMRLSSSAPWPSLKPSRAPRMTWGAWVMFSMPPATVTSASPRSMSWDAEITDWIPEPHRRFTVSAGVSIGSPAFNAECRAPYIPSADVCIAFPITTCSTSAAGTPDRSNAALIAWAPREFALMSLK